MGLHDTAAPPVQPSQPTHTCDLGTRYTVGQEVLVPCKRLIAIRQSMRAYGGVDGAASSTPA